MSAPLHNKIFCALDTPDLDRALELADALKGSVGGLKVGLEFYSAQGPAGVKRISESGLPLFLDLKFHDIPNTVASAIRALNPLNPALLTIHAAGGPAMMQAAAEAAKDWENPPLVLGVTVMTSLDDDDLRDTGIDTSTSDQVKRLAALALKSGLGGVVCSPFEIAMLKQEFGTGLTLVVPGIRPVGADKGDQKRVMAAKEAIDLGADFLVIGRPITGAPDPVAVACEIAASLAQD
jgi:orotidine-5'-phosphate decarboxylase